VVRTTHQVGSYGRAVQYEIRVAGHLGTRWAAWFDGLSVTTAEDGTTVLRGSVVDQAALHGLLQKLRDIGIPLISFTPIEASTTEGPALHDERN
jgi:hypothetical protein